ncbi:diadenylate cyclase [Alteribacillus persepolensis]|uniref:DNA integrity scanning protein DisA n=1 Tax=Alteribacillus persepolensis TaxID=568899 RepID=A0A1G8HHC9_9BACI|nr:DNA integrity scanning diadenylate cyclase DisA [Alteribacillus persepolensis]SDI06097.1 diadenylate cyclase [Alteribacillus persepolensis]
MSEKERNTRDSFMREVLHFVAPGTALREGIDNVLRANTGGLIVLGYSERMKDIVDGGFFINCSFTPSNLYELAKMDGAIILTEEGDRILYANTQLVPDNTIVSSETGIRHRTAERVAKQTGNLVISISQRRRIITLYRGSYRYSLKDMEMILTKANQAVQTLEKYKAVLDQSLTNIGALEFEELVTFHDVAQVIHRIELVNRIRDEILNYVLELGSEGRLISMQLNELVGQLDKETRYLIKDYIADVSTNPAIIIKKLSNMTNEELMDDAHIMKVLGYSARTNNNEQPVSPRGYRILHKIQRLPALIIDNLVRHYKSLEGIMKATIEDLDEVPGVGRTRAKKVKEGLHRIQEQLFIDRHI